MFIQQADARILLCVGVRGDESNGVLYSQNLFLLCIGDGDSKFLL